MSPFILALIAVVVSGVLIVWLLTVVGTVAGAAYSARRAWNDLNDALDARRRLVPMLAEQVDQRFTYDPDILRPLTQLKAEPPDGEQPVRRMRREVEQGEMVARIAGRLAQYQILLDGTALTDLCCQLVDANERVGRVTIRYNQSAAEFNLHRREFAKSTVARAFSATDMPIFPIRVSASEKEVSLLRFASGNSQAD